MTVQLASYKGKGDLANRFIRWWTGSIYSHCELVVDGVSFSSSLMDGGVRCKVIDLDNGNWDVVDIPWADADEVIDYFIRTGHQRYGILSLIYNQMLNRGKSSKSPFCSEWCGAALGLPSPSSLSPNTLKGWCDYITNINNYS